jgi:type VI secretion system protein ImpH
VSDRTDIENEPYRFDFFRVLRELERAAPDKPRIGDSAVMDEDVVQLAQDPFLAFPASNVSALEKMASGRPRLHTRFLGFFGPQGALPLTTTLEAYGWQRQQDPSFARFTDVFANRFLQLFFRAWSDSRPIAQRDRPGHDRFVDYVGAFAGIGSAAFRDRDFNPDIGKLPFAGLVASRVKSARRLCQLLRGVLGLAATITERVGSWLEFEPSDRTALGAPGCALGATTFLGTRAYSINDKFRISVRTESLEDYVRLLPNQPMADRLADLVFFYIGHRYEFDVELALPARCAPAAQLGKFGQLGWTAWLGSPAKSPDDDTYLTDARFDLAERRNASRLARETA